MDEFHKVKVSNGARSKEAVDKLVGEIESSEAEARSLLKDLKKFSEVQEIIRKSEVKIVGGLKKNLSGVKTGSSGLISAVNRWSDLLQDSRLQIARFDAACTEPLKEYLGLISSHRAGVKRLDNAVQEHTRASARWKKVEKDGKYSVTTAKLAELTTEITETENMVDSLTATLEKDLQIVLDKSTEFFLQLMANATENQRVLYQSSYKEYSSLNREAFQQSSMTEKVLEERSRSLLKELDSLSIVDKPKDPP